MAEILLTKGKIAIIDYKDTHLNKYKWYALNSNGVFYAARITIADRKRILTLMHHAVVGRPINKNEIDHINGDGLDNRRENLRSVSHRENGSNQKCHRSGRKSSKYVGVSWDKLRNKWLAGIWVNGKNIKMGRFDSEEEAHEVYENKLKELNNSYLN